MYTKKLTLIFESCIIIALTRIKGGIHSMVSKSFEITTLLHGLGVSSKLKGFSYLYDIIYDVISNEYNSFKMIELYRSLSQKYDSSCSNITKCIRESIEKSWNNGSVDLIEKVFGYSIGYDNNFPSNSLYVNTVVDYLRECSL